MERTLIAPDDVRPGFAVGGSAGRSVLSTNTSNATSTATAAVTSRAIAPDELPDHVLVDVDPSIRSPEAGWDGLSLRAFSSGAADIVMPPLRDHLISVYTGRRTAMQRCVDGRWSAEALGVGDVSVLTRGVASHWVCAGRVDVLNVHLRHDRLNATCAQMFDRDVTDVDLFDRLDARDSRLHRIVTALQEEAAHGGPGSRLLVGSLTAELAVAILRRHAHVRFRELRGPGVLTFAQERLVREYVRDNLSRNLGLDELSGLLFLSRFHFVRVWRRTTGMTPHQYVQGERTARAQDLLRRTDLPVAVIAATCGYADQSHLTRSFRQRVGKTPATYRKVMRS